MPYSLEVPGRGLKLDLFENRHAQWFQFLLQSFVFEKIIQPQLVQPVADFEEDSDSFDDVLVSLPASRGPPRIMKSNLEKESIVTSHPKKKIKSSKAKKMTVTADAFKIIVES